MHIVGESYRQAALLEIAGGRRGQYGHHLLVRAMLVAEVGNVHDPTAVAVFAETADRRWLQVGYLARARAARFHARLRRGGSVCCPAEIRGGNVHEGDDKQFGIVLYPRQAEI